MSTFSDDLIGEMSERELDEACDRARLHNREAEAKLMRRFPHHGQETILSGYTVTFLDPILSLGSATNVSAMFRARKLGASPIDDCLLFEEFGRFACYRHLICDALPVVLRVHQSYALNAEERES